MFNFQMFASLTFQETETEVEGLFLLVTTRLIRCSGSRLTSDFPSRCLIKSIQTIAPLGWKYGFGVL